MGGRLSLAVGQFLVDAWSCSVLRAVRSLGTCRPPPRRDGAPQVPSRMLALLPARASSAVVAVAGQPAPEGLQVRLVLLGLRVVAGAVVLGHRTRRALVFRVLLTLNDLPGVLALGHRRVPAAAELRLLWLAHGCSLLWQTRNV